MKRILLLLAFLLPLLTGCNPYKELRINSVKLESVSPKGMSSLDAVVSLGVHNPSAAFWVSGLSGKVTSGEKQLLAFKAEDFRVEAKCDSVYSLSLDSSLDRSLNIFSLMKLFSGMDKTGMMVEIRAKIGPRQETGKVVVYKESLDKLWKRLQ